MRLTERQQSLVSAMQAGSRLIWSPSKGWLLIGTGEKAFGVSASVAQGLAHRGGLITHHSGYPGQPDAEQYFLSSELAGSTPD